MKISLMCFSVFALAVGSILSGCKKDETLTPTPTQLINSKQHRTGSVTCGESKVVNLIAGQHIVAGTVTVTNNATDLLVTYTTTNGWYIKELHLFAGDCALIPANRSGNPIPGQFPNKNTFSGSSTTTYTYSIPLANLPECYCVAAHAVVSKPGVGTETAWGQGTRIVSKGNWAMKFEYCKQRCEPVPDGCSLSPDPIVSEVGETWPTATVSVGGFTYTQAEANDLYTQPTTDARIAFIYIAAMKLSGSSLSPTAAIWTEVAQVEAWLATVGKLSASNLPNAPLEIGSAISTIRRWVNENQCE